MIWCLTQLQKTTNFEGDGPDEKVTSDTTGSVEKEGSFVTYMDMALDTLSPLSLYPSDENRDQNSVKSNGDVCNLLDTFCALDSCKTRRNLWNFFLNIHKFSTDLPRKPESSEYYRAINGTSNGIC